MLAVRPLMGLDSRLDRDEFPRRDRAGRMKRLYLELVDEEVMLSGLKNGASLVVF